MGVLVQDNQLNNRQSRLIALFIRLCAGHGRVNLAACIMIGSLFAPVWVSAADINQPSEYEIKAAYLYNVTKFIRWPSHTVHDRDTETFHSCILGLNLFGDAFHKARDKSGADDNVVVRNIDSVPKQGGCHVLFISQSEVNQLSQLLQSVAALPILTVSDIEGFAIGGGCIELATIDNKAVFSVNLQSANRARLKFSAQLLELAKVVIGK